jgi:hypothetical protein
LSKTPSGDDTPGLVFKTLNGSNILPNNFIFTFNCQHPETGNVVSTLSFQRALINVLPPTPIVLSNTDFPVPGNPGVSLCQKLQTDPSLQFPVVISPNPGSFTSESILATVEGDNGSSTVDLDEQDLSFDIRSMSIRSATPGDNTYSPIPQGDWPEHWRLDPSQTADINRDLVAGSLFEENRAYLVEIAAVDASGFYGASCYASFILFTPASIKFNMNIEQLVFPCPSTDASFTPFLLDNLFITNNAPPVIDSINETPISIEVIGDSVQLTAELTIVCNDPSYTGGDFTAKCNFDLGGGNSANLSVTGDVGTAIISTTFNLPAGFTSSSGSKISVISIEDAGGQLNIPNFAKVSAVLTFTACSN